MKKCTSLRIIFIIRIRLLLMLKMAFSRREVAMEEPRDRQRAKAPRDHRTVNLQLRTYRLVSANSSNRSSIKTIKREWSDLETNRWRESINKRNIFSH